MKKTHHTTEQIIRILREAETSGQSHEDAIAAERESLPGGGVGEINAREAGVGSHIVHWRRPRRAGKGQGVASGRSPARAPTAPVRPRGPIRVSTEAAPSGCAGESR